MSLHPATVLLAWLSFAAVLPWLDARIVGFIAVAALTLWWSPAMRSGIMPLLRRTQFLFLALVLIDAFATPGVPLLDAWPGASAPTLEGVQLAAVHAGRLLLVLVSLGVVLATLGEKRLVAALYFLLRPLAALGVPVQRLGVRLALVMEYARETRPALFSASGVARAMTAIPSAGPNHVEFVLPPFGWQDGMVLVLVLIFEAWVVL